MDRHLLLVPLFLSCALAAPQFAYTSAFQHPYVPLPFGRAPVYDVYNNQLDRSPQEAAPEPARLTPSPYHFIPATLPLAIYSEPAHILSGYTYQTIDPAGAKSQVLFVSGPNSQQLFRQNADLLNIVLPSPFNPYVTNFIPRPYPGWDAAAIPPQGENEGAPADPAADPATDPASDPTTDPTPKLATDAASSSESESSSEATSSTTGAFEPKVEDASPEPKSEEDNTSLEDVKPTLISPVFGDDTSKEEADKSSEVEGSTSIPAVKEDEVKIDVSTSEASNSVKTVPPEGDSSESASTEIPSTNDKNDASESTSEKVNSGEKSSKDQTTVSSVAETTIAPAKK